MQAGFDHSKGKYVVTMDGDLQNDPGDIPKILEKLDDGYDLVAGYREQRKDSFATRKVPSWIANRMIAAMTGVPIRDNGCSLKGYTRGLLNQLRLYSDMHRFIPAVAAGVAGARIAEVPVKHHPRRYGVSKYGLSRIGKVLADVVTVAMIRSFRVRPLALYALPAAAALVTALAVGAVGTMVRLRAGGEVSLVYPGISLVFIALSVYLVMLGLVGEVVVVRATDDHRRIPILHPSSPQTGVR